MAKCKLCGKNRLFQKTNDNGLCAKCELADLRKQIEAVQKKRTNEEALLQAAISKAEAKAQAELAPLLMNVTQKQQEYASLLKSMDETQNKERLLSTRIEKLSSVLKSIKYSITVYPEKADSAALSSLETSMELLVPPAQGLNCLTIKELRLKYRNLEKQIKDTYEKYQSRYTTKANASLYRLMVLALNAELQLVLSRLTIKKLDDAITDVRTLTAKYYQIIADGNQSIAPTLARFTGQIESLYVDAVKVEYEYFVRRERAKEEQRAIREQMKQEAAERKQLELERKKIENEEQKYRQEIERITAVMESASKEQIAALRKQLEAVQSQLLSVEDKKAVIINLQNGKAGTVYVISNLGSFGDGLFKIGMTRRSEPQDRITELSDASVPFPFDVHSFIFSQDAVSLEAELHRRLNDRRANKVNLRKEFFNVTLDELESMVTEIDPSAPFNRTMAAEQYRQSLSLDNPIDIDDDIDIDEEQDDA